MDNVKKTTQSLEERGLHQQSYFEAHALDGAVHREHDTNWSDISTQQEVTRNGMPFTVHACHLPLQRLFVKHNDLETTVDIPEGHQVYQAIVGMASFTDTQRNEIIGRVVGLVKDGQVIEERFLDARHGQVTGVKF